MTCPKCGEQCTQDMVDVGVGEMPSGPMGCENCGWVDRQPSDLIEDDDCPTCGGSGELAHDCGDDTCCCLNPYGDPCPTCNCGGL